MNKVRQCDVLVIGGGGAGALAALQASRDERLQVVLLSKGPIGMSGLTPTANGGTAGAGPEEHLFQLMITSGRFLNDQDVAWFMTHRIKDALEELTGLGMEVVPLRGRSVAVQSKKVLRKLRDHIIHQPNIELREDVLVSRLFSSGGAALGVAALDMASGELFAIEAKAIVLATGGSTGELYPHTSNNPFGISTGASGTGHVMALEAGADLVDMEMIQFVPLPASPRALHLRYFPEFWNGPYRNRSGEVIEDDVSRYPAASYSPEFVQKLFLETARGKGPIFVDQRSSPPVDTNLQIPEWDQRRRCIHSLGIDPRDQKIEVTLGSHFSMGGVKVNARTETAVRGLFAAGEVMGGVHGACRLSGYSFSQMIVFGFEAGERAAAYAREEGPAGSLSRSDLEEEDRRIHRFMEQKPEPLSVTALKNRLKQVMERHVFISRNSQGLAQAVREIELIKGQIARIQVPSFGRFNLEWARAIEFPCVVETARVVARSALAREESRGFHCRSDFPTEDNDRWLCHTTVRRDGGKTVIGSSPVVVDHLSPRASMAV